MHRIIFVIVVTPALLAVAFAQPPSKTVTPSPQPAELVKAYKTLINKTPQGFTVNPSLAMLCIGASATQIRQAETHHGPHAYASVTIYVNPMADAALKKKASVFPVDAVIIKEKQAYSSHVGPQRRNGVTGMIKREAGYDPKNGDWEYFIQEEGKAIERGKIATCIGCHAKTPGPDHLFATWRTEKDSGSLDTIFYKKTK
jgi:hypothetical protein